MDKDGSLKNNGRIYEASSRFEFIEAVEWASERMVLELRDYVQLHERGPSEIIIRANKYSPFLCMSRLQGEINTSGLTSRISSSSNGVPKKTGRLVLDLDSLADQYSGRVPEDPDEIFR